MTLVVAPADLEIVVNPANPLAGNKLDLTGTFGSDPMLFCHESSYWRKSLNFDLSLISVTINWYINGILWIPNVIVTTQPNINLT